MTAFFFFFFFLKYFKFHNKDPFGNFWSPYPRGKTTAATRLESSGTCSCQCVQYFCTSKKWYGCQWWWFFSRCSCIWLYWLTMLNLNIISINIKVMDKPCNDVIQTVGPTVSTALLFDDNYCRVKLSRPETDTLIAWGREREGGGWLVKRNNQ